MKYVLLKIPDNFTLEVILPDQITHIELTMNQMWHIKRCLELLDFNCEVCNTILPQIQKLTETI